MLQHFAHSPHRLGRLAWLGALLLVLRFAGAELHEVLDTHEPGESCAYCLVLERGGHALPAGEALIAALPEAVGATAIPCLPPLHAPRPAPLPRGPPLLSA